MDNLELKGELGAEEMDFTAESVRSVVPVHANIFTLNTDGTNATLTFGMKEVALGVSHSKNILAVSSVTMSVGLLANFVDSASEISKMVEAARERNNVGA